MTRFDGPQVPAGGNKGVAAASKTTDDRPAAQSACVAHVTTIGFAFDE